MNNGRFATSLHILTVLGFHKGELISSAYIAESVNVNRAIIRKEMLALKEAGLIHCKEGKGGGTELARSTRSIKLADIYNAVNDSPLLGRVNETNRKCPIGKAMNKHIDHLYDDAEKALMKKLNSITLSDFIEQFK